MPLEPKYNNDHFTGRSYIAIYSKGTAYCLEIRPIGVSLEDRIVEAEKATEILGQDRIDQLVKQRFVNPCKFDAKLGKHYYSKDGYEFLKEAQADYNKILCEVARSDDYSEVD